MPGQGWAQAPGTQLHSTVSLLSASQETDLFGEMHSGIKRILEKDKSENRPTAHHVPSTVVNALYDSLIGSSPGLRGSNCFHSHFGNEETTLEDVVKPPQGLITNMVAAIDFEQIKQIKRQGLNA